MQSVGDLYSEFGAGVVQFDADGGCHRHSRLHKAIGTAQAELLIVIAVPISTDD
jgi:hypothetical protein